MSDKLTTKQAASLLGIHRKTLTRFALQGKIRGERVPGPNANNLNKCRWEFDRQKILDDYRRIKLPNNGSRYLEAMANGGRLEASNV